MIEIKKVTFSHGPQVILDEFSAQIRNGESVLLTGDNGVGKSTLVSLIGGFLKPDSGSIEIVGNDISKLKAHEQAELRSVAPQRRTFDLAFTVQNVLNFVPVNRRSEMTHQIIEDLGLVDLIDKKVTELSIGQQQRVSLALALIQEADFYLLDEPFSAQDKGSINRILMVIDEMKKRKGILVVSHNADALRSHFDREIVLS
jgi:ABC-type Mn2+/Zn2+ transport system ATPase subunit